MRSTAPFAVSAAPAEAGHDMNAGAADTVTAYTVKHIQKGLTLLSLFTIGKFKVLLPTWADACRCDKTWKKEGK